VRPVAWAAFIPKEYALWVQKKVVLWDINKAALDKLTHQLKAQGHQVFSYPVDVTDLVQIKKTAQMVLTQVGKIEILFNNAGIIVGKDFQKCTHDEIHRVMAVNTLAMMDIALIFLPQIVAGKGHLINVASASGLIPVPKMSVYVGSKWAILGWSESLRIELESKYKGQVHVTTVLPSFVATDMFKGAQAPLLTPILSPEKVVKTVIRSVERNKIMVKMPWSVNLLSILRGILPTKLFDWLVGRISGVYSSMNSFEGNSL